LTTASAGPLGGRTEILGCPIDVVDMEQALAECERFIQARDTAGSRGFAQHMAINAAKIVSMRDDPQLRELIAQSELVTADGQAIVWASKVLGDPLPVRVAGIDLMQALLARAEERGWRVYILGAEQSVLETAVARIRDRHPQLEFAGYRNGYFDSSEERQVAEEIRASRPDILFVAISSPRKEYFLGDHGPTLGVPFVMGVGGSIDVIAGKTRRAPVWMQKTGLEWLYRLAQEPRRMFKRYASTNLRFIAIVLRAMAGRRRSQP
jgi:N-acetylglucosaminyldiphosphoundecaprenol N-acetyl-beta-D-mannosaminyltransferase